MRLAGSSHKFLLLRHSLLCQGGSVGPDSNSPPQTQVSPHDPLSVVSSIESASLAISLKAGLLAICLTW